MRQSFQILLRTTSPLHVTSPDGGYYYDTESGYILNTTTPKGGQFPISRIPRKAVAGTVDSPGFVVPFIESNGLRGMLRRQAADQVKDALIARNEFLSPEAFHVLECGAATGEPSGKPLTVSEAKRSLSHPVVGLFGGTPKMVRSALAIENAYPITKATIDAGLVPEDYRDQITIPPSFQDVRMVRDTGNLTQVVSIARKDDMLVWSNGRDEKVLKDGAKAYVDWQAGLADNKEYRKNKDANGGTASEEGDAAKKGQRGIQGINFHEALLIGTRMYFGAHVDSALIGAEGVGCFLTSMCLFANKQAIGGKSSHGYGRFEMNLTMTCSNGKRCIVLKRDGDRYTLDLGIPEVAEAVDAWSKFLTTVTAGSITESMNID